MNRDDCNTVLGWVCDGLDGAAGVPQDRVEAHLAGCERCRAEAARLAADDTLLREWGRAAPPDAGLLHRLRQQLRGLPPLLPGRVNDRHLSDEDLQWLSAAGTGLPPWTPPPGKD
jgi:anti-sigma factor RsiW